MPNVFYFYEHNILMLCYGLDLIQLRVTYLCFFINKNTGLKKTFFVYYVGPLKHSVQFWFGCIWNWLKFGSARIDLKSWCSVVWSLGRSLIFRFVLRPIEFDVFPSLFRALLHKLQYALFPSVSQKNFKPEFL